LNCAMAITIAPVRCYVKVTKGGLCEREHELKGLMRGWCAGRVTAGIDRLIYGLAATCLRLLADVQEPFSGSSLVFVGRVLKVLSSWSSW